MPAILRQPLRWVLRLFFRLLYHEMAWTYDWVAGIVSLNRWQDWVRSVLPHIQSNRILEIGHGPGHLQEAMLEMGQFCFGIDASPQMSRQASRKLKQKMLNPMLVNARAQSIPFPDNSFERLVATFPSEYIADSHTLSEIKRVLTPGGQAVILLLAWITGKSPLERAAQGLFRITGQTFQWDDQFLAPLRRAGFQAHAEFKEFNHSRLLLIFLDKT